MLFKVVVICNLCLFDMFRKEDFGRLMDQRRQFSRESQLFLRAVVKKGESQLVSQDNAKDVWDSGGK